MAKLSQKRKDAIYRAVYDRLMDCRIEIARMTNGQQVGVKLDTMIARAQGDAASAAVSAAEGKLPAPPRQR